jgi:hypothetical protein
MAFAFPVCRALGNRDYLLRPVMFDRGERDMEN